MITYLYWGLVFGLAAAVIFFVGIKLDNWIVASIGAAVIVVVGWAAFTFHFQQIFVKQWGGVMSLTVPNGQRHIIATWKDNNLWVENFDPATNTCIFTEYSKGNMLQGRVKIKNCNPLGVQR